MRTDLTDRRSELLTSVHRFFCDLDKPLYAVIDTARDRRTFSLLEKADCAYQGVYPEGFYLAMDHRGPHLVALRPESSFLGELIAFGWGKSWGIYLTGPSDIAVVRRHLRRLISVKLEDGRQALFRFYDPCVLRDYLPSCSGEELESFFGPCSAVYLESRSGCEIVRFSRERFSKTGACE